MSVLATLALRIVCNHKVIRCQIDRAAPEIAETFEQVDNPQWLGGIFIDNEQRPATVRLPVITVSV